MNSTDQASPGAKEVGKALTSIASPAHLDNTFCCFGTIVTEKEHMQVENVMSQPVAISLGEIPQPVVPIIPVAKKKAKGRARK